MWATVQPETASSCELDDPESMEDLWVRRRSQPALPCARLIAGSRGLPYFSLVALQAHQPAAVALVRPRVGPRPRTSARRCCSRSIARRARARGRLGIARLRLGGRSAPRGQPQYFEFRHDTLQRQAQAIADAHAMRRFDALRVQMNFAAVDRSRRQASRFVKTGMPQPFVEAMLSVFSVGCHNHLIIGAKPL